MTGTYFNCIMFMVASSVVTTIMILNYHHRQADTHTMPTWVSGTVHSDVFLNSNNYFRWELCFCSGYHGSWGWVDPEKSWPGRRSWSRARWRSWTWRRLPPSLCWPMCWTWMMTTDQTTGAISRFPLWITHFTGIYSYSDNLTWWYDEKEK